MLGVGATGEKPLVLYDGVCGLCDRLVAFLLERDGNDALRFAPLQSDLAREILARHGVVLASDLDTVYVIDGYGGHERLYARSRAVLLTLARIGGFWRVVSWLRVIPAPLSNLVYGFVARVRHRLFGKHDTCAVPPAGWQQKFLA
jgi:predicted DCC family thiol-disulfide oxidoreductase YuxK